MHNVKLNTQRLKHNQDYRLERRWKLSKDCWKKQTNKQTNGENLCYGVDSQSKMDAKEANVVTYFTKLNKKRLPDAFEVVRCIWSCIQSHLASFISELYSDKIYLQEAGTVLLS